MEKLNSESKALELINFITGSAINGVACLCSAENLAMEYRIDLSYPDDEERIEALINWETTKNFTSGFITGLGGVITLPVAIPGAFVASWIIQARMVAAIADLAGYDLKSDRVRTFVIACLLGATCKDVVKTAGIHAGNGIAKSAINRIPGKAILAINKKVGTRLFTKAGKTGAVNLVKMVPLAGGIIGGAFDAGTCRIVGKQAKRLFYRQGTC